MNLDDVLLTFIAECRELLAAQEEALLRLEEDPSDQEAIGAVFRAAHTIKGSAGLFGLDAIVTFTHRLETVLDLVRDGELAADADLVALLLACGDHIGGLVDRLATGGADAIAGEPESGLLGRLAAYLPADSVAASSVDDTVAGGVWQIAVRFGRDVFRNGMDPIGFLGYIGTLGEIVAVAPLCEQVPRSSHLDPESCYLGFELALRGDVTKRAIEDAFEFVRDDAEVTILAPDSKVEDFIGLINSMPDEYARIGDLLVASGAVTERELEEALAVQTRCSAEGSKARIGEILVEHMVAPAAVVEAAAEKQQVAARRQADKYIRIEAAKLDHLINLVGELVVSGAAVALRAQVIGDAQLLEASAAVAQTVEQMRESSLQLRMVQIGDTFNRFKRVVHDVSHELGKEIRLYIAGAETELDKTVIEKIGDPLTHLIRNAVDHGIEPVAKRRERGKPDVGTVGLDAYHESGSIVIEVSDDGGGIDTVRLRAKAADKGILAPDATLSEQEAIGLIFAAGLSSAAEVTNLSGRGVGMDVVRRNIEALRGTVEVESVPERGTTIRIRLPLTLAIIDGFLLRVGESFFVVPLDVVEECREFTPLHPAERPQQDLINLRGEALPCVRLRELFGIAGGKGRRENVVVVQYAGRKAGLVIDELLGEYQTVIKPLGGLFEHLRGIAGSTILGTGRVALILDVAALVGWVAEREERGDARPKLRVVSRA